MYFDKRIGNYHFNTRNILGKGSTGFVYVGIDQRNQQKVAIKVFTKSVHNDEINQALRQEVMILRKMKCEYIVKLLDYIETVQSQYLVLEYCQDGDLKKRLKKQGSIKEDAAMKILGQLLAALKYLQNLRIIHRDLKPANILFSGNTIKLADFGLSRHIHKQDQMMNSFVGTPIYMSPQILLEKEYTSKCDIWSIGVIYYECLYAKTPWKAQTTEALANLIGQCNISFPEIPQISKQSKELIQRCCAVAENNRISWIELFNYKLFNNIETIGQQNDLQMKATRQLIQDVLVRKKITIEQLFEKISINGRVPLTQFHYLLYSINPTFNLEDTHIIFNVIDKNKTNRLTIQDFEDWLYEVDSPDSPCKREKQSFARNSIQDLQITEKTINELLNIIESQELLKLKFTENKLSNLEIIEIARQIEPQISQIHMQTIFLFFERKKSQSYEDSPMRPKARSDESELTDEEEQQATSPQKSLNGPGHKLIKQNSCPLNNFYNQKQ